MLKIFKINFLKNLNLILNNNQGPNKLNLNSNLVKKYFSFTNSKPEIKKFEKNKYNSNNKNLSLKSNYKKNKLNFLSQENSTQSGSHSESNIFNLKNHKDLKKIYHINQMYDFTGSQINKIVDILDYYVTLNQKNTIKSAEEILSQDSFCSELIKKIKNHTNDLDNKSILKIFNLNCNLFTKIVVRNENLNKLAFSLTKDINFEKFFRNIEKFRNVSDLFLHFNNMQNIIKSDKVGDYKISLKEPKNFFYFKSSLFAKCVLKKLDLQKYPTLTLTSLFWVFGKNGLKQIDVFDGLIRELFNRVKYLNIKNLITIFSVIEKFNLFEYDKNILKSFIRKFNSFKSDLEKELKSSDVSYLISIVKFLSVYKISQDVNIKFEFDEEILKIVDRLCLDYLNKEKTLDDYNLTLILKYFFIFQKEKNVQFVIDKIFDRFSHMIGNPILNIFSLFFHINFDRIENWEFLQQFNQLFYELFEISDLERSKLTYKEYLQTVFCLFQIDYFSTRVKNLMINQKIRNFMTSLLNENFLNKITEDFYETCELLETLNLISIHNGDLYEQMKLTCQNELNILLKNKFEINSEFNLNKEESSENEMQENVIIIDDFGKNNLYSLIQVMDIVMIIHSLNLDIDQELLDKLKLNLNSQENERGKLTLQQKMIYNYLIKYFNYSNQTCEIDKNDVENNILRHNKLIEKILLERIKEIKSSLYIETNFIQDKKFHFDLFIPSIKKAYIINITSGLLQLERHISFPNINKEHIFYGNLTRHLKSRYDIELFVINEDFILNQSNDRKKILNQILESSLDIK